eukprot:3257646-Amphidinium_carterae.1
MGVGKRCSYHARCETTGAPAETQASWTETHCLLGPAVARAPRGFAAVQMWTIGCDIEALLPSLPAAASFMTVGYACFVVQAAAWPALSGHGDKLALYYVVRSNTSKSRPPISCRLVYQHVAAQLLCDHRNFEFLGLRCGSTRNPFDNVRSILNRWDLATHVRSAAEQNFKFDAGTWSKALTKDRLRHFDVARRCPKREVLMCPLPRSVSAIPIWQSLTNLL